MAHRQPKKRLTQSAGPVADSATTLKSVERKEIKSLCAEIADAFHPDRIVLFGSYAYGKPRPGSDIDLLIVMPFEGSPFRQASIVLGHVVQALGVMPLDLLVRTGQQVEQRIQMGDSFIREIIERGQVYEVGSAGIIH